MNELTNKVKQSDKQCEHLCLIGLKHYKDETGQHYTIPLFPTNMITDDDKTTMIEIFNVCPRCGQDLVVVINRKMKEMLTFYKDS